MAPTRRKVLASLGFTAATGAALPVAAQGRGGALLAVGLFVDLSAQDAPPGADAIQTTGHHRPGVGAAKYACVAESDQQASGLGLRAGAAVARTSNGRWFELSEEQPSVLMFGAVGDFVTDDTAAIQAAIDFASRSRRTLRVPQTRQAYLLSPSIPLEDEDRSVDTLAALLLRSDLHIEAERGAIFRMRGGVSTDRRPQSMGMLCTNQVLRNITIVGLTMDMNGAENPISPDRARDEYTYLNQSQIFVSGTPGGVAAQIDDVVIRDCRFINNAGVCCICMAQSNQIGVTLGKRWSVLNCAFVNNGGDTPDHTAIFGWADDVLIQGNVFHNETMWGTVGRTGGNTSFEVHGSNLRYIGNSVSNYLKGVGLSSNYTADCENILIASNTFSPIKLYGVDFFRDRPALTQFKNVVISGNTFDIDDSVSATLKFDFKTVINIACQYSVGFCKITNNVASKKGAGVSSAFVTVTPGLNANQPHTDIVVDNNAVTGFTFGAFIRTTARNGLGYISVKDNKWKNLTPTKLHTDPAGIAILYTQTPRRIATLAIDGNECVDDRPAPLCSYGIYASGEVGTFLMGSNPCSRMKRADYHEADFKVAERKPYR